MHREDYEIPGRVTGGDTIAVGMEHRLTRCRSCMMEAPPSLAQASALGALVLLSLSPAGAIV